MPNDMDRAYVTWTGRKRTALRRPVLDCGHPNNGEVFYHAWCDRLSCSTSCANADHDCSAFAGVRSGIGEGQDVVDAEVPPAFYDALGAALEEIGEGPGQHAAALAARDTPTAPACQACGNRFRALGDRGLCVYCSTRPPARDRVAEAMRSEVRRQGLAPCEIQIDGRTEWLPAESADVRMMTPEEAAGWQATQRLSLECSRRWRGCSGCDGLAMDHFPCMHDCHEPAVCSCPQIDVSTFTDVPAARRFTQGYEPGCRVCPDPYARPGHPVDAALHVTDEAAERLWDEIANEPPWWRRIWRRR